MLPFDISDPFGLFYPSLFCLIAGSYLPTTMPFGGDPFFIATFLGETF